MRELSLRLLLAFVLCIVFGVAFGYIAAAVGNESIAHFDTAVIGFVQGLEAPWLTSIMKVFTWIGSGYRRCSNCLDRVYCLVLFTCATVIRHFY